MRKISFIMLGVLLLASFGQLVAQAAEPGQKAAITLSEIGLQQPESVLYDSRNDVYLVSSINGTPAGEDNNGFISRVSPEGKVLDLKWIAGGQKGVTLSAPKGLAIVDNTLYVSDINAVRSFDLQSGQPKDNIIIPETGFLNDLVASPDGQLYVTEMGLQINGDAFVPTGKDAVYRINTRNTPKTAQLIIKNTQLGNPNGLTLLADGRLIMAPFNESGDLYVIKPDGTSSVLGRLPGGQLDGIVTLPGDILLASSWKTNKIYQYQPNGTVSEAYSSKAPAADIGYDTKRQALLIPFLYENQLVIQPFAVPAMPSTGQGNANTANDFSSVAWVLGGLLLVALVAFGGLRFKPRY